MNTDSFLKQSADRFPDHPAIIDQYGQMSYSELNNAVDQVALLLTDSGIHNSQGIGVLGANSRDFVVMAFAVMRTGAVMMPVAPNLSEAELSDLILQSGLHAVCFNHSYKLLEDQPQQINTQNLKTHWSIWFNKKADPNTAYCAHVKDAVFLRYTSGTTGTSKGVVLSHKSIEARTRIANEVLQLSEKDKVVWVLSMAFHFVVSIILYLRYGCTIIINNNFLATSILESAITHKATFLYASPMHIRMLTQDKSSAQLTEMKKVVSTSTGISAKECELFYERFHIPVMQAYGIIEIGLPLINHKNALQHPDSIGYAVPGMSVKILDDAGLELPAGSEGNLAISGPGMFDAYLSPPLSRDEILQHGYFYTGDLATRNEEGLFTVVGRIKSMINVGGNKVFPEEVEDVLLQFDGILSCRVSGYKHPLSGESVMAEIVLYKNAAQPDSEVLYSFCKKHLSPYKVPQKFIFVNELPMTKSGKIKR